MKAGVDFQHMLLRRQTFSFVTGSSVSPAASPARACADFLLDWPNQVQEAVTGVPGIRPGEQFMRLFGWRLHSFFTDDWKVTPKLTVSMGLRWELNSPIRDIRGLTPNFDFTTQQTLPGAVPLAVSLQLESSRFCAAASVWRAVPSEAIRRWCAPLMASSTT